MVNNSKILLGTIGFMVTSNYLLYAQNVEIGCSIEVSNKQETSCEEENPFKEKTFLLKNLEVNNEEAKKVQEPSNQKIDINKNLTSVNVKYKKKNFLIQRETKSKDFSCPPYCLQPITIANVKTVGELETLKFIASLENQKDAILVDARTTAWYKESTIPTATNIPYTMLSHKSKHRNTILKLLGAKKLQGKWYFKHVQKLLIFDSGVWDFQANQMITTLIKLGYPQSKILYYRGGLRSWQEAGLTRF
ncbi:MAG: rhodanese-like domain-containing protein [Epsilonproteobacteria bacterium]|nr:rhodanese-like domain-containing protein [Campylobacterota bacterium]